MPDQTFLRHRRSISHSSSPYSSFYPSLYHSISPSLSFRLHPSSLSSLLPPSHCMTLYSPSILPSIPLSISHTSLCSFPLIILLYPSLSLFLSLSLPMSLSMHSKPCPFAKQFCMANTAIFTANTTFQSNHKLIFQSRQM